MDSGTNKATTVTRFYRVPNGACSDADNWFGVEDARKRKQIQDRLAQRARRKRLSNPADKDKPTSVSRPRAKPVPSNIEAPPIIERQEPVAPQDPGACLCAVSTLSSDASEQGLIETPNLPPLTSSVGLDHQIPLPSLTVYTALFFNSRILGIACSVQIPSKSNLVAPHVPSSLQPSIVQLTTIHHRFIDSFPFPRLRDSMISLGSLIDEEDFLGDLFTTPSFTLSPGGQSWDSDVWKIGDDFKAKWGYLFL